VLRSRRARHRDADATSYLHPDLRGRCAPPGRLRAIASMPEFGRFVQSEVNKWKELAGKVGIVAE
jgi:hypothetical protein